MNNYLSEFQFFGSSVKHIKIKNDFISLENTINAKKKLDITHSVISVSAYDNNKTYMGILQLNIKYTLSENKKKYTIDLQIEGCFTAPESIGEDTFKSMLQINGITSLYSLARAFIHSTTSQTLVDGSILLPMINVVSYSKDLDAKEEQ